MRPASFQERNNQSSTAIILKVVNGSYMQVNPCCTETVSDIGRSDNVAMGSIDYRGKEIYGETSRGKCEEEAMVFTGKLVAKRQEPEL